MAEPLPTVDVTGNTWNSFNELDLLFPGYFNPGFYGTSDPTVASTDSGSGGTEAFAPPVPEVLPEVIVQPKPIPPIPVTVPVTTTVLGTALTGLVALLFPQPTGPREFDEAPGGGGAAPPTSPPGAEDPVMPPNWWDLINEPFPVEKPGPPLIPIPIPPVEMPPNEPEFIVSPPGVTNPSTPWLDPFTWKPTIDPIEVPIGFPGIELAPDNEPDTRPGPAPTPTSTPGSDPNPFSPDLVPDERRRPAPDPFDPTAPDLFSPTLPDGFVDPIGDPITAPIMPERTRPDTRTPTVTTVPDPFVDPVGPELFAPPELEPILTEFGPNPVRPTADTCQCDKKPKQKKKKREPRTVCYKGTYQQRANGTIFRPTEEVPCDAALPKKVSKRETDPFGRPVPKKRGKRRTPTWQDTINDVFYPKP